MIYEVKLKTNIIKLNIINNQYFIHSIFMQLK